MEMCLIQRVKKHGQNKNEKMIQRRKFLKAAGLAAGYWALHPSLAFGEQLFSPATKEFGIQLYTLRDILPGHAKNILKQLASFGYTQLESYEGPEGIFWNMSPKEFNDYTSDLGMKIVSTHCEIFTDFEKKVDEAVSIGMKYIICPWVGPQKSIDEFKRIAALFNEKGQYCKKHGIQFAYHNHDYSFRPMNGVFPQDILMKETDPAFVQFELDMYWAVTAGQDPIAWMEKYPNRFKLAHIKDKSRTPINQGNFESVDVGTGSINYAQLIKKAKQLGLNYFLIEQEFYLNSSPLQAAEVGAAYMKKLK